MLDWTVAAECFEKINTVSGLLLNLLLLYVIKRFSGTHLGIYKHLLAIFTLVDLFLVLLHTILQPRVLLAGYAHGTVTDTMFDDKRITALYIGFQSVPFTLLGIDFLYRYWCVRSPHLIELFKRKSFITFLLTITVGVLLSWYFLSLYASSSHNDGVGLRAVVNEYERKYGKRIKNAWIVFDHWPNNRFDAALSMIISFMDIIMITSLILAALFAFLTFQHINESFKMSSRDSILQRKLLVALCVQTAIPSVFVYIPYLICINLPFVGFSGITIFHDMCAPIFTCFPVWDAAVILLLVTDYRRGLVSMITSRYSHSSNAVQVIAVPQH